MSRCPLMLMLLIAAVAGCGRSSAPPQPTTKLAAPSPSASAAQKPAVAADQAVTPAETQHDTPPAVEPPPAAKPIAPAGRVIIISPAGPLLVDLLISIDGESLAEVRQRNVRDLVERVAQAGGATLTWDAALADPRFTFGEEPPSRQDRKTLIASVDANRDGLVQPDEAVNYYAQVVSIGPALRFAVSEQSWSDREASRLWRLADLNGDGAIDAEELARLPQTLESHDADGNDLVDVAELADSVAPNDLIATQQMGRASSSNPQLAVLCDAAFRGDAIAYTLEEIYPLEQRRAAELTTVDRLIASVDKNLNGRIDGRESLALVTAPPLGRIHLRYGSDVALDGALTIEWLDPELEKVAQQKASANSLVSELAGSRLLLERTSTPRSLPGTGNPLASQFQQFDRDANGYLEKNEIPQGNRDLDRLFRAADANGDDKLYRAEVDEFAGWQDDLRSAAVRLDVSAAADPLFGILDASGDNRLSQRELRAAPQALSAHDRTGDGKLEIDELPVEIRLVFGRLEPDKPATADAGKQSTGSDPAATASTESQAAAAPEWFTRMDQNGDGDLSPAEFLGNREQFEALDMDRDGFIVAAEAKRSQ